MLSGLGARNPTPWEIILRPAAGTIRLPLYRGGSATRKQQDNTLTGTYDSGESVPTRDVARRVRMFSRGAGWSSRPGPLEVGEEWDGYAESENACLRFGYVCPSGEQAAVAVTAAWGQPRKLISFNGDLFFIFENRIAYLDGGAGALIDLYALSGDLFTDAEIWGGSLRVSNLCTHTGVGAGNHHSFVTITPGAPYTVTHPDETAAAGVPYQFRLLQTAFWEYEGVAGLRLMGQVSDYEFRYMIVPNGDVYDPLNWGPAIRVGDTTYQIRRMVSSHDTVWFAKRDGVWAVTDKNASAGGENITPYWREQLDPVDAMINVHYWGSQVVASHGLGVDLIDVNSWQVKDAPKPAHISHGRPNNTSLNGRYTAFCTDGGWLVAAQVGASGAVVSYGTRRQRESASAGVTEVDWFSEVGPLADGHDVVAMVVHTTDAGRPYLWLGIADGAGNPSLISVELFQGTSPLADANHRYNTSASVTMTDEHWAARVATKGALRGELSVRNCGSGRSVAVYAVAGAGAAFPGTANHTVSTNVEAASFNLTSVRGSTIRAKLALTSTATVPVVIDEWGLKANLGFPLRRRGTWLVEVGTATSGDLPSGASPSRVTAALKALCESVEDVECVNADGETVTVVIDNVLPWRHAERSDAEQRVRVLEVGWQEIAS